MDALTENEGSDAREGLANFIGELFVATSNIKLLITSDKSLKEFKDCYLSCHEEVGDGTM